MLLMFDVSKCFFVERSSASNGGSIHMARTSGWIDPLLDAPQKPSF